MKNKGEEVASVANEGRINVEALESHDTPTINAQGVGEVHTPTVLLL